VDATPVDYIVPSENGGKADVHWVAFTKPPSGDGLLLQYTCQDPYPGLDDPRDMAAVGRPKDTRGAQIGASRLSMEELDPWLGLPRSMVGV